jgi:hypothetical protein
MNQGSKFKVQGSKFKVQRWAGSLSFEVLRCLEWKTFVGNGRFAQGAGLLRGEVIAWVFTPLIADVHGSSVMIESTGNVEGPPLNFEL